jgi:GTPase SAR1 family protein
LAIVGEFSSGKSTFINALLRDDLLMQSPMVATATATTLRHGDSLRVVARFKDSNRQTVKAQPKHTYDEIREFIYATTSVGKVAKDVTEISITHPAAFLATGIVVIDTPGTNAPDAETSSREHEGIVRRVLENEADGAIVVMSAERVATQTLNQFLNSALKPFLHRCLFVVTKMRNIPPEQHGTVIDFAKAKLASSLDIDPPEVYPCSAQAVLDNIHGMAPGDPLNWTDRFVELEGRVKERLSRERALSIAENIVRLLDRLLEQLERDLQHLEEENRKRRAVIEHQTIRDLPSFAAEERTQCHRMFDRAISVKRTREHVSILANARRHNTTSVIHDGILAAENISSLNDFLQNEVEALLEEDQRLFSQDLEGQFVELQLEVNDIAHYFDTKLAAEYRRLGALGGQFKESPTYRENGGRTSTSNVVSSTQSVRAALDARESGSILGGAGAGAALGTLLMPGIGSLIGGGIGLVFGALFGGVSLDGHKQRYWEKIAVALDDYFDQVEGWAQAELDAFERKAKSSLTSHIDRQVTAYKSAVDAMISEQQKQKQQLQRLQRATRADLAQIRSRRKALNQQRGRLRTMAG